MVHIKRLGYWCTGIISRSLGYSSGRSRAVSVSSGMGKQILASTGDREPEAVRRYSGDAAMADTCYVLSMACCLLHKVTVTGKTVL